MSPVPVITLLSTLVLAADTQPTKLTIKTPELVVTMEAKSSWTIRSVEFQGAKLIEPKGGQGAVLLPAGGKWVGSAMGKDVTEPVTAFDIVSGQVERHADGSAIARGDQVTIKKESKLGGFTHAAVTTFEADRFVQSHRFVATEEVNARTFYAFIYSFTTAAQQWAGQPMSGALRRGTFHQAGDHAPSAPCLWLAQYDAKSGKGALIYFKTPFAGRGASTEFWDAKSYHKFLAQPLRGKIAKGTELDYTIVVKFFTAPADTWVDDVKVFVKDLEKEFPPMPAQQPAQPKLYGEGVPETGDLVCKTAHYTVQFVAKAAWTPHRMDYDGQTFAGPTGWYGTVLVPKGGRWWGTGHTEGGKEIVHSLKLTVDGKEQGFGPGAVVKGNKITLLKESTIWKLKATVEVTITDDYIFERTRLEPTEDIEMSLMYYFMHCFIPSTTQWAAELPGGEFETGALDHNKGFSINKDTRWVAQYEPDMGLSILCYTPKVIAGNRSASKIWNQPHYHKLYYQQNRGQAFKQGEKLDYSVVVQAVPGETGDWAKTKQAAAKLKELFPEGERPE